jgi:hypothetical protein
MVADHRTQPTPALRLASTALTLVVLGTSSTLASPKTHVCLDKGRTLDGAEELARLLEGEAHDHAADDKLACLLLASARRIEIDGRLLALSDLACSRGRR